jgi:hypothetical protein
MMDGVSSYLNNGNGQPTLNARLLNQILNVAFSRSRLAQYMSEGDVRRNINHECGYPETESITCEMLRELYDRDAIAARVVDLFPEECWQVTPWVYEDEDPSELTPFEQGLDDVVKGLRGTSWFESEDGNPLWEHLLRADRLCGVGSYGVLLLGLDDGKDLSEPAEGVDERGQKTGNTTGRKLLFLREFDETLAKVDAYEADPTNPRYGQPTQYSLTFDDPKLRKETSTQANVTKTVHWTRVVHVADNLGTSDLFGVPRLQPVFNRVQDLRKLYGGSAEMYWKGAFPGMGLVTNPQLGSDVSFPTNIKDTMEEYFNGLQRYLGISGVEPKMLSPTVVDPTGQVKLHLEAICIRLAIPMRVFLGSERGELASSQDSKAWTDRLRRRQNSWITPRLVCPVIDRLICLGVLPQPEKYMVEWPDIAAQTDAEKMQNALQKTQAIGSYIQGQLESIMTPMSYLTKVLDYSEEEASAILEEAEVNVAEKLSLDLPPVGQEFGGGAQENPFGQQPDGKQQMVDEDGQPLPPEEQIDAEAEVKKQELEEEPLPGVPEALVNALPPEFLKQEEEEEPAEDELLDPATGEAIPPEVDPITGEPVSPEIDPLTGEPVEPEIDPVTGLPVEQKSGYDALLEEAKGVLPVRGGLLPSDHVPGLRERLLREGEEEAGIGTADEEMPGVEDDLGFLDDEGSGTADGEDEEPEGPPEPGRAEDGLPPESEEENEEETRNTFCATGEGGGVDPTCGGDGVAGGRAQAKVTSMKNPWSEQIAGENDRFYNAKRAADWTNKHFSEATKRMSPKDLKTVDVYAGGRFSNVNDGLRGTSKMDDVDKAIVKGLDEAVAKSESPEEVMVFRGAQEVGFLGDPSNLVGKTLLEKGYTSTSLMEEVANGFAYSRGEQDDARFEIKIPKGAKMLSVDSLLGDRSLSQHEMILPRGSRFKVTGATPKTLKGTKKKFWVIEMELQI